jgi:hypothetical protein
MNPRGIWTQLAEFFWSDPLTAVSCAVALFALASTPIAFAVLGRLDWFKSRRGRILQRPEFSSIVVGMMLVMAIPAILLALFVKSRSFDKDRYEFDPNRTITVLDQGRGYKTREAMEAAIRQEVTRVVGQRKALADQVMALDDAMTRLLAASCQVPGIAPAASAVLDRLATVRKYEKNRSDLDPDLLLTRIVQGKGFESRDEIETAIAGEMKRLDEDRKVLAESIKKLDDALMPLRAAAPLSAPALTALRESFKPLSALHKLVGLDAPQQLIDLKANPEGMPATPAVAAVPTQPAPSASAPIAAATGAAAGLSKPEIESEIASVPEPQRALAGLLPLSDLPQGWIVAKSGDKHLETFNADNLFEKIDGRAESFIQYNVKGMAYTYYHPEGDEGSEAQLYIFEMADPLKAFGKFGSEKPDGAAAIPVGTEGYISAGSTFFFLGKYYTQIVTTKDDAKLAAFSLDIAKKVAASIKAAGGGKNADAAAGKAQASLEDLFSLLPAVSNRSTPKYVTQDVFGYSFLTDVFLADYKEGEIQWQGFLRPYESPEAAKAVFEKYQTEVKRDGAQIKKVSAPGADEMIVATNIGLIDAIFLKGNVLGGVNGSTDAAKAESFAKDFVKGLPKSIPYLDTNKKPPAANEAERAGEEKS